MINYQIILLTWHQGVEGKHAISNSDRAGAISRFNYLTKLVENAKAGNKSAAQELRMWCEEQGIKQVVGVEGLYGVSSVKIL